MTISTTAAYLSQAIDASGRTQRDIAKQAGLPTPNVLSMMRHGETKVPLRRIPALARARGLRPADFLELALAEYHPELQSILKETFGRPLGETEQQVLQVLAAADPDGVLLLGETESRLLFALFEYMIDGPTLPDDGEEDEME